MKFLDPHKLGKNNEHTKRLNRATVIALLRQHGGLSRADLSRETALTMQSISNIIGGLEESGLIEATEKIYGGKGQPPLPYAIRPSCGHGIGINLDDGRIFGAVIDFGLNLVFSCEEPHSLTDPAEILTLVEAMTQRLIEGSGVNPATIWGIGLVSPRLVDHGVDDAHLVESSLWADIGDFGIEARLAASSRLPVFVENDANAGALGELTFGAGKKLESFCYLHIARGLGCGIIHESQIFRGAWGNAGEFGRFPIPTANGEQHLESILSIDGLFAAAGESPPQQLTSDGLAAFSHRHCDLVDSWVVTAGGCLRWLMSIVENAYDPQTVLIGGQLPEPLLRRVVEAAMPLHRTISERPRQEIDRLQLSLLKDQAAVLGAATIPVLATIQAVPEDNWRFSGRITDVYPA